MLFIFRTVSFQQYAGEAGVVTGADVRDRAGFLYCVGNKKDTYILSLKDMCGIKRSAKVKGVRCIFIKDRRQNEAGRVCIRGCRILPQIY